ncbi:MAG: biotin--[acetyl-CoA-carboxylase] ligase [Pseudomonadota bacterium]
MVTPLALRNARARAVTCFETDSTNARLLRALKQGLARSAALAAEQQTRGRGRHERRWLTPLGGGVALSVAWPYALLPGGHPPAALSLRVGVALAQACARLGVRSVRLKWPNDLIVDGRKLGGILIEGGAAGLVVGVGLNHAFPRGWRSRVGQPLTSLSDILGRRVPPRSRVLDVVLDALMAEMCSDDEAWRESFARRDALAGRPVRVSGAGGDVWEGVAGGVTEDGALRVITPGGERLCHAGEASVRGGG